MVDWFQIKEGGHTMTSLKSLIEFLQKEKVISLSSILAIFISFTLLSFIFTFLVFSNTSLNFLQKQVQVRVFFKDSFGEEQIKQVKSVLENDSRVLEVTYTSKEDALKIFRDLSKNDPVLQESLTTNILPASLEIKAKDVKDLDFFYEDFLGKDFVESVKYLKDIKDKFKYYSTVVTAICLVITLLFFIVSFGIILSTIRINIFQKKDEIEIMKLVGASDDFVETPFIHQGIVYAMVGSFFAGLLFTIILLIIYFTNFLGLRDTNYVYLIGNFRIPYLLFVVLLVAVINLLGYLLGKLGSKTAVQKYLKV
jgi:cell division transport system permease protein